MSTSKPAHVEFRHATVVDDVNIFVSRDFGWTAEQLAHMTVGIGLRLFPRVEPPKRWQRWSVVGDFFGWRMLREREREAETDR